MAHPLLAIFGPTAVGKTAVALAVAERLAAAGHGSEAVGADALQVYRELPILTAQPTAAERAALHHHLVGHVPVHEGWSVAEHARAAHAAIDAIRSAGRVPILVGGTGLYLRASVAELSLAPPPPAHLRDELTAAAATPSGLTALHAALVARDPTSAALIAPTDRTRVVRAHELLAVGSTFAAQQRDALWSAQPRVPTVLVGLTMERETLRARAEQRVGSMLEQGVQDELRRAEELGPSPTARAAIGYAELLAGDAEAATLRTRQLAKRQQTWMRRLEGVTILDITDTDPTAAADQILSLWRTQATC